MERYTNFSSKVILLPVNDIDTDQIIPARFLKVTDKAGLGANLFSNWRYLADGSPNPQFVLNQIQSQGAQIILAGNNFGCGSSREHAPWALLGYGIRAVISTSFADIFRNNSLKNGMLPIQVEADVHKVLIEYLSNHPDASLSVNLEKQEISIPDLPPFPFPVDGFSKTCLLQGVDELGYLLDMDGIIAAYEQKDHQVL
jgi:3-isopropylmalate/(R)-2-methylmalate dehydratase small subunit